MNLRKIRIALRDDVVSERHTKTFQAARSREPALAEHDTIVGALNVLNDESEARYHEREAITRALIREYQSTRGAFWASVLTLAFMPMMLRLRCRLVSDPATRSELEQRVVATFLDAVATISLEAHGTRIAMHLRQLTQRRLFAQLDAERKDREQFNALCEGAAHDAEFKVFDAPWADATIGAQEAADLGEHLQEIVGDRMPADRLDVVIATRVAGEKLAAFVERTHAARGAETRSRTYQRLKRERIRSCEAIRPFITERMSLFEAPDALLSLCARS
jgi:hypothetical protein